MKRLKSFTWFVLGVVLFISGCSATATESNEPPEASREINLKEYSIGAGKVRLLTSEDPVRITIKNKGAIPHNFVVDQLGVDSGILAPGNSAMVEIDAKAAMVLQAKCTLPGHAEAGMVAELKVDE
ncbi:hypothetical protein BG53_01675 [Paenibacillus darwinianus]|uniref:EfeO-type cupredoxin-like domain-containing protein n=1 Tax=Paenibacillus darwinianus TaxID=1380763 RepID=A0A9W5S1C0_9BACL|nr:hypothetical protein [Paenibacillus darwinianus]EXX88284.1 hypothetical protein BG52_02395 [Paenibacillus darwinianus]EXX88621.1 hypothetical protein BG53_01675 [Paenibacillus darwinianus]EXX91773.1 hypothetical protein CH50_12880 [Paenibacillus darwinianus]